MAFWPRDERTKAPTIKRRNEVAKEQHQDYPNIMQGLVGAATLVDDQNKRLKWTFLTTPSGLNEESLTRRLRFGKQISVFPATRSLPLQSASSSIKQRAEQGANFLRTYVPDVEIPEELIRDQLVEDTTRSRELQNFDPYSGNVLETLEFESRKNTSFLLFPTGETNRDLNFTQIQYPDRLNVVFKPAKKSLFTFTTPIQQIVSKRAGNLQQDTTLVVRTYTSTHLFDVKYSNTSSTLNITDLATLTRQDTAGETIVDFKHSLTSPGMLLVGDCGTVFDWDLDAGKQITTLFQQDRTNSSFSDTNLFWRLAFGINSEYFCHSERQILQLDRRTHSSANLFSVRSGKHILTSMEDCLNNSILHLCTTNDIIWLDTRFPNKPLLAYAHGRQYDRYLATCTFTNLSDTSLTLLSSRKNNMVTVYEANRSTDGLIRLDSPPYLLSSDASVYRANVSRNFVCQDNRLGFACISDTGEIKYNEILIPGMQFETDYAVEISKEMQKLAKGSGKLRADVGSLGIQEFSEVELQSTYDSLFREHFDGTKSFEEETADAVYQMLDFFPSYLQNKELPAENVLTTYDIAFRAGDEPSKPSRADFLTDTILKSKRAFRALKQGKFSPDLIKAPWNRSLITTLQRLDKDFRPEPLQLMEYLQKFRLSDQHPHPDIREYEQDASQELTLDLILSSHIYSEAAFIKRNEVDQSLEVMTEALSLGGEPPQIEFGFLRPVERPSSRFDVEDRQNEQSAEIPLGVRLLLQEWDSADPADYIFKDSYNVTDAPMPIKPKKVPPDIHLPIVTPSQRPPAVLPSNMFGASQPEPGRKTMPPKVQSQGFGSYPEKLAETYPLVESQSGASQTLMMNSQVLPGPHGGRPVAKKKPAKKRLGGF